jgi:F5/8 type C domain
VSWDLDGPTLTLDLGRTRVFGWLVLQWGEHPASAYKISASDDGTQWRVLRHVYNGNGGRDDIVLPKSKARYLQILPMEGPGPDFTLAEISVEPF